MNKGEDDNTPFTTLVPSVGWSCGCFIFYLLDSINICRQSHTGDIFSYTGFCSFVSSLICPTNTSKTIVISESYSLCDSLIVNYLRSTRLQLCSVYVLTGPYLDALCRGAGHFVGARG